MTTYQCTYEKITEKDRKTIYDFVGCCYEVYNELHGGLLESIYEAALAYELQLKQIKLEDQKDLPVYYKGIRLPKQFRMDLVLENRIIVELKTVSSLQSDHRMQLFNYMRLSVPCFLH